MESHLRIRCPEQQSNRRAWPAGYRCAARLPQRHSRYKEPHKKDSSAADAHLMITLVLGPATCAGILPFSKFCPQVANVNYEPGGGPRHGIHLVRRQPRRTPFTGAVRCCGAHDSDARRRTELEFQKGQRVREDRLSQPHKASFGG